MLAHGGVDVPELGVSVDVIGPLLGFPIALQAILLLMQKLGDFGVADGVLLSRQCSGNIARALADPAQWRLRVATGLILNERLEGLNKGRITGLNFLSACPSSTDASGRQWRSCFDFSNAIANGLSGQTAGTRHHGDASTAQTHGFVGRNQTLGAFVQKRPKCSQFVGQIGSRGHIVLFSHPNNNAMFIYLHSLSVCFME